MKNSTEWVITYVIGITAGISAVFISGYSSDLDRAWLMFSTGLYSFVYSVAFIVGTIYDAKEAK